MAWPDVHSVAGESLLVMPLGSTEQHGPHLPLGTDTHVAVALAESLARTRDDVLVAPPLPYGSSGEHAGFAGTLSIGGAALTSVVLELVRSADAFKGVVIVSGHGGNAQALASAVHTLRSEGRRVMSWAPTIIGGDSHAGQTETSLMLAVRADTVSMARAEAGSLRPLAELMPILRRQGVLAVSPNGVLGDPRGGTVEEGIQRLAVLADELAEAVRSWLS
jgi:creatinine amidohydrolase